MLAEGSTVGAPLLVQHQILFAQALDLGRDLGLPFLKVLSKRGPHSFESFDTRLVPAPTEYLFDQAGRSRVQGVRSRPWEHIHRSNRPVGYERTFDDFITRLAI
jgi:hypothetical protein